MTLQSQSDDIKRNYDCFPPKWLQYVVMWERLPVLENDQSSE